jgi:hypothetical protein
MGPKSQICCLAAILAGTILCSSCDSTVNRSEYFTITVIDSQTGRGVPLVELQTVNDIRYYTDSNGIIAFYEPGLMDRSVFFHIQSHGYEVPADGFGYRGKTLHTTPGDGATIQITRNNIAERLYRITGQGIYRDTVLTGGKPPLKKPVLNGRVLGQDTVMAAVYKDKIYWFWGDTDRESYPLGHFAVSGATSELPQNGGLDPSIGIDLRYFVDEQGFSRPMVLLEKVRPGTMIWIDALMLLEDQQGHERLLAHYACMASLTERLEHGLVMFDDKKEVFVKLVEFPQEAKLEPGGHPFTVPVNDEDYLYFAWSPYPLVRVKADWQHVTDLSSYEAFTCLKQGSLYNRRTPAFDYAEDGTLKWGWKKDTAAVNVRQHRDLIADGTMKPEQAWLDLRDVETNQPIYAQGGSVHWNSFRQKWIMIVGQVEGSSNLGEIWYAETDAPEGPWRWARKIITHTHYSFYNPTQHAFFDEKNGQIIYIEGTYTQSFSGAAFAAPRYDYNQIMYRLDLSDPRLRMPE